ncbi:MAG: TIGR01212 family radical SAM protein [Clostridia bacterium]|nr:TIGR01212 family radical SAM protein [Clostridia bacterium]
MKSKYGKRLSKICIDGGFGCPNRDGKCGTGGCIYCGERGAGEHINGTPSIGEQVAEQLKRGTPDSLYIAYFQNFTNTYAPLEVLKGRYDSALIDERITALAIGTRPDCIDEDVAKLIAGYKERVDVWVELGLQTASDVTAKVINRGYNTEVYRRAAELLTSHGIPFVTHMIIGLPGEKEEDTDATVDLINECGSWGVKIHSIYVMEGTGLADMYRRGEYLPPSQEEYTSLAARAIARLRPDIIVHRVTGDCPEGLLVAPRWNKDKNATINMIRHKLEERDLRQGSLYKK